MSKKRLTPAAAIVGTALVGGLSAADIASAAENPFVATQLESGYMLLAGTEGSCGEGKCGEGKCGNTDEGSDGDKGSEGKCGGDQT